jgi:predicted transcriptional regulator
MTRNQGRSLATKRRMLGMTQHMLAHRARIPINRLVFAETGRIDLRPDELDRVRTVFRDRAKKAMAICA